MKSLKASVPALALLALAAGGIGAVTLFPADLHAQTSQDTPAAAPQAQPQREHHRAVDPSRYVEGRIAFTKTVLKITPAQEDQFNKLADALRANAKERMTAFEQFRQNRDKPKNAVEQLELREQMSQMRAAQEGRVLAAFKPLYDSLSPDQKKAADEMSSMDHGHRHGHRG